MNTPGGSRRPRLLFVYNADSGLFNTLTDIAHKVLSPSTYACALCTLSHGYLSERKEWRAAIEALDADCVFLHRDQLNAWPAISGSDFPAVFREQPAGWQLCLGPAQIAACADVKGLVDQLRNACLSR